MDSFCYSVWDDDDMAAQATALQLCPFSIAPFVITRVLDAELNSEL